jgi:hypothetical protein
LRQIKETPTACDCDPWDMVKDNACRLKFEWLAYSFGSHYMSCYVTIWNVHDPNKLKKLSVSWHYSLDSHSDKSQGPIGGVGYLEGKS